MLENKLNELNIFALRDLARKSGVSSPTSKRKEELISEIVEIHSGKKQPEMKSKQGRPPKVFGYDFVDVFNATNQVGGIVSLKQKTKQFSDDDVKTLAGWLEPVNNNSAILWVNSNCKMEKFFVSKEVLQGVNIKIGDRAGAEVAVENNQQVISKIFSVNDVPVSKFNNKRVDYDSLEHCSVVKELKFSKPEYDNLNLNYAENVYIYGENNKTNSLFVLDMLKACKVRNKLYINVSMLEKNKFMLQGFEGVEKFVSGVEVQIESVCAMLMMAIERAKRIAEMGEDVVVAIDDMLSISAFDKDDFNFVKKLCSLSKLASNNGSVTLLAVMPNDKLIAIEKLADSRLKINNNMIEKY